MYQITKQVLQVDASKAFSHALTTDMDKCSFDKLRDNNTSLHRTTVTRVAQLSTGHNTHTQGSHSCRKLAEKIKAAVISWSLQEGKGVSDNTVNVQLASSLRSKFAGPNMN